ncbi:MAG: protease modulator HflC [Magnetospirillum sp. WYHS-4]
MNGKASLAILGVVGVVAVGLAATSLFTVHQRHQALVLQFGNPIRVEREPGLKVKLPWQNVETYERRILDLDPPGQEVLLSDQKRIIVDAFARFRIVDPLEYRKKAVTEANFRQVFGGRLNSSVRSEVAKVSLADLLTEKRAQVMDIIADQMKGQAKEFGVEVVDVRIGRADLPEAISQATYNRMRSERLAKAAQLRAEGAELKAKIQGDADRERTIILAEAQREAQVLRGEGDATRTTILNDAYGRDPEFFGLYRSLDAYGVAFGEGTTMVLKPDSEFFRYFGTANRKK